MRVKISRQARESEPKLNSKNKTKTIQSYTVHKDNEDPKFAVQKDSEDQRFTTQTTMMIQNGGSHLSHNRSIAPFSQSLPSHFQGNRAMRVQRQRIPRKRVKQPSAQRLAKGWHRPLVQVPSTLDLLNQRNQSSSRLSEGLDRDHSVAHSPVPLQSLSLVNQLQLVVNKDARTTVPNEGSLATTMSSDGRKVVLVVLQALHGNNCDFCEIPHGVRLQLLGTTQLFLLRFRFAGKAGHHQIVACPLPLAQGVNASSRDVRPSRQWVIEGHRAVPVNGHQWPFRVLFTQVDPRGFWNRGCRLRWWCPEG